MKHISAFLTQVVSSSITILITIIVARETSSVELGELAVMMAIQIIVTGILRAFSTEPLLYSHSTYFGGGDRNAVGASTSLNFLVAFLAGLIALVVAAVFSAGAAWMTLGALLFVTSPQEHLRTTLIARGRASVTLLAESLGVAVILIGSCIPAFQGGDLVVYIWLWVAGAALSLAVMLLVLRPVLGGRAGIEYGRLNFRDGVVFAFDFSITSGLWQGSVLAVASIVGPLGAAALRGAQVMVTPISLSNRAFATAITPVIVNASAHGRSRKTVVAAVSLSAASLVATMITLLWFVIPVPIVELILGDSAQPSLDVLLPVAISLGLIGIATGADKWLRAQGLVRRATLIKLLCAPIGLVGVVLGAMAGGAGGSQAGFAIGETIRSVSAWCLVRLKYKR